MKDDPFKSCPKELCRQKTWGKGRVTRLLGTGAGLIFKGSGFYTTDYRSTGYHEAAKKDKPASESKPAEPAKPAKPAAAPAEKAPAKKTKH